MRLNQLGANCTACQLRTHPTPDERLPQDSYAFKQDSRGNFGVLVQMKSNGENLGKPVVPVSGRIGREGTLECCYGILGALLWGKIESAEGPRAPMRAHSHPTWHVRTNHE